MVITLCVLQLCIRFAHHEERNKTGVWSVPVVCTYNPMNTSIVDARLDCVCMVLYTVVG